MKRMYRRTLLAAVLAAIAVAVPCTAWFVVGSRGIERERARFERERKNAVQDKAGRLAKRLAARLQTLRDNESRRPFYHYQNLYHDPQGASEGLSVIPSPLAQGPADPLIWSYFQVGAEGKLSIPTINEDIAERNVPGAQSVQSAIKKKLQTIAGRLVAALPEDPAARLPDVPAAKQAPAQVQVLEPSAYNQNILANDVYLNIKRSDRFVIEPPPTPKVVVIRIGWLQWRTMSLQGIPLLVSLREVYTPDGRLTQGFAISAGAIADWLGATEAAAQAARFEAGEARQAGEAAVPIEGAAWKIACDPAPALAAAQMDANQARERFQRSFFAGLSAACVAAVCIVLIVWQTERLARQRSQFAASAAHELRTPLAGLRIYSEMMAEGLGDPAKTVNYTRRIAGEAGRLGRVVANMLGFTRLERGALKVEPKPGNLGEFVRECVGRQQPALEAAGAQIEFSCPADLPAVKFDRDAVAEIVQNLLDNAEKHTRSAGNRTIAVTLAQAGEAVRLSVRDHGAGIPAGARRRLFRPFARFARAEAPTGLGLGLVLVRALARGHGGDAACSDAPGGGAMFTVIFPI
jgi:signal transduction histidine kinase